MLISIQLVFLTMYSLLQVTIDTLIEVKSLNQGIRRTIQSKIDEKL